MKFECVDSSIEVKKGDFTQEQVMKAESRFRGIATLSLTSALDGAGGLGHTQSALL
jgi:hypothetical protein